MPSPRLETYSIFKVGETAVEQPAMVAWTGSNAAAAALAAGAGGAIVVVIGIALMVRTRQAAYAPPSARGLVGV